jgi:hypothetical protein
MESFIVVLIFFLLRVLINRPNPETDPSDLSQQADQFAAAGDYVKAEERLRRLLGIAERRHGHDSIEIAS